MRSTLADRSQTRRGGKLAIATVAGLSLLASVLLATAAVATPRSTARSKPVTSPKAVTASKAVGSPKAGAIWKPIAKPVTPTRPTFPSKSVTAPEVVASFPVTPPAQICGNAAVLNGPAAPPAGAVVVPAGDDTSDLTMFMYDPGDTFYFAAGTHTLGTGLYSQILPANNTTYLGAPGAIINGQGDNAFAFTQQATGVTIEYLTIENFVAPVNQGVVNHDSGNGWTIEHDTITDNGGAGVIVGPNDVVSYDCLSNNGQYGFSAFYVGGQNNNITLSHNEIAGNNTANTEVMYPGCGCSGAGKIWNTVGGNITDNWVHNNKGPGIWADTDNAGLLISGNYINNNDDEAIIYELSYNGQITDNNIIDNGLVLGQLLQTQSSTYPATTIYLSNSGGDPRVDGGLYATFDISGNNLAGNWGGVQLFEDADRYCGSPATDSTYCTMVNPAANLTTCVAGTINTAPYLSDCVWKTQNVQVFDNTFSLNPASIGCTSVACETQAVFANGGTTPAWSPYLGFGDDNAITTTQNNNFYDNTYTGNWLFDYATASASNDFNQWQGSPINEDAGSTMNGTTSPPSLPGNLVDADSSDLAGSVGHWVPWVNTSVAQNTTQHQSGTDSLQVNQNGPTVWGLEMNNYPGFTAAPGPMTLSFWGLANAANELPSGATLTANWEDVNHNVLGTTTAALKTLTTTWQQATTTATAPPGTAYLTVQLTYAGGEAWNTYYFDNFYIGPAPLPDGGSPGA